MEKILEKQVDVPSEPDESAELSEAQLALIGGGIGETVL